MKASLALLFVLGAGTAAHAQAWHALDDPALAEERGGYLTAGGISFDFGAQISTYVDNQLVLQSHFTLNGQGVSASQTGGSVSIPGDGGQTQVSQILGPSQLANVVLNTASNRAIRQDTAVTVVIPGLSALQGQIGLAKLGSQLSAAAATGVVGRLGQ